MVIHGIVIEIFLSSRRVLGPKNKAKRVDGLNYSLYKNKGIIIIIKL